MGDVSLLHSWLDLLLVISTSPNSHVVSYKRYAIILYTVLLFCETTECPTECGGNSSCNTLLGLCECDPGYRGYNCSQGNSHLPSLHSASHGFCSLYIVCLPETFGSNCSETCTCEADSNCHHITGDCTCPPGYLGTNCSHGTQ